MRSNIATAPNDSQNPADSGAHGSNATTPAPAHANTLPAVNGSRDIAAANTTDNMKNVRRAGTPQPANRQYSKATTAAAAPPATRDGMNSAKPTPRHRARRQAAATSTPAMPAMDVTCMPLIDTRCVMPLRLKMRQSSRATPA
ncbi:hypothetical protein D3C87_1668490 [compost metagenome]